MEIHLAITAHGHGLGLVVDFDDVHSSRGSVSYAVPFVQVLFSTWIFISVDMYLFLALCIFFLMTRIFPGDTYFSGPCFRLPGGLINTRYRAMGAMHIIEVNDKTQPMTMGCDGEMDFHVIQFCLGIHMCSGHPSGSTDLCQ